MIIYKIINNKNNKIYIGQTIYKAEKRFKDHKRAYKKYVESGKTTTKLYNAFKKYGIENFSVEIIEKCENKEQLNKKEIYWIEKLNTMNCGYNTIEGGKAATTTIEIKKVLSEKAIERFSTNKGDKTRKAVSEKQKERIKNGTHKFCGKSGINHFRHKKIKQLTVDGNIIAVYNGSFEAQRNTGVSQSDIIKSCNNKRDHTPGGYIWVYEFITTQEMNEKIKRVLKIKQKNEITIKNLKTGIITKYDNATDAAKELNISRSLITYMRRENKKINKNKNFEIL